MSIQRSKPLRRHQIAARLAPRVEAGPRDRHAHLVVLMGETIVQGSERNMPQKAPCWRDQARRQTRELPEEITDDEIAPPPAATPRRKLRLT
jgi:hypothetical protein